MANDGTSPFALISPAVIDRLKSEAATPTALHLIKEADKDLGQTPDPLPRVHTAGTLPHQGIWDQSVAAKKDWTRMLTLGLAYRLTGDPRYLKAAERFISAWATVYQFSFNPIDETSMDQILLAYDLSRPGLSQPTQEKMTAFLHTMAEGYLDKIAREKTGKASDSQTNSINNWQSHRIKLITLAAYALGDTDLIARAHQAFQAQILVNIKPDGSVVDFYTRDALHYVVYDLEPLSTASLAAKAHGDDWFHAATSSGTSLELALDWLMPFALGQKTHEEFVHSTVPFDIARAKAGVKGFAGVWDPAMSIDLYQLAALADAKYTPTLQQIVSKSGQAPQEWLTLLRQAGL